MKTRSFVLIINFSNKLKLCASKPVRTQSPKRSITIRISKNDNMKNIKFNLTKILNNLNTKIKNPEGIELLLGDDSITFRNGGVVYFCDHEKFIEVLEINNFDYNKSDIEDLDVELLSKHIVNQLTASMGVKIYPEVKTLPSDLNQK